MRSTNQVATQFRRQADQASEASRAEIVAQAQLIDSEGQPSQFFYCSTIQPATAVTKALKASFTYVAAIDEKPAAVSVEENKSAQAPEQSLKLETNLVTFSSNVLKVYALPSDDSPSIDLRLSTQFNGRILDVIKVPTLPFLRDERTTQGDVNEGKKPKKGSTANEQMPSARDVRNSRRKQRDIEEIIDTTEVKHVAETPKQAQQQFDPESAPDYLFVILANFTVALVCYSKREHKIEVVSRGNISEKILHDQKEPPYPVFLGQTGTFIVLMLYHNILKVIPLVKEPEGHQHIISLTHATAVRVRHSNVMQVVPLYQEGSPLQPTFGVIYQRTDHIRIPGQSGPPALSIKIELEKQLYDIEKRDLTPHVHNGGKLEFSSNSVYRIEPLTFGGFLAFDIDKVSYYRKELVGSNRAYHEQLKSAHSVTAFCQVDEFDNEKGATKTGVPFVRFLFATEAGELFMLAIHTELLREVLTGSTLDIGESLINIEFLASKLTFCSSLVYLDDSLVFYSSKEGDSYVLKICAEHQGSQEQPYISIEQRFTSLAPIMDLQLARPENTQGQQSELVIVGGWNHQTNMNLVKQGVGLRSIQSFESILPSDMVQEYHTTGDLLLMRMYGYDQLIGMKVRQGTENQGVINVDGFDVSRNFSIKPTEQILLLSGVKLVHKVQSKKPKKGKEEPMVIDLEEEKKKEKTLKAIVYATNNSIKILDQAGEQFGSTLLCELSAEDNKAMTLVKLSGDNILIALQGGTIKHCQLSLSEDGTVVSFTGFERLEMGSEISAMCIADDTELSLFYVTLFDAPHFSLNVVALIEGNLRVLARIPLASVLESTQTWKFYQHELVKGGYAFSQFSVSKKAVLLDLPNAAAATGEDKMEVDASSSFAKQHPKDDGITMQFNCSAARSIDHLTLKTQETDQILIGFANGKIMQLCLDLTHLKAIFEENFPPFLDFQAYVESRLSVENSKSDNKQLGKGHEDLNFEQAGPFWGAQLCYVGTIHPKMRKIKTEQGKEAVIACCDRPVVFYEANESIEMHYLAFTHVREISYLAASSGDGSRKRPFLLYEDKRGVLHLSENDNLRRLQVQRMVFKMQISKTLLIPTNDSIVVLLEQPNLDYIDSSKQACNAVGLVSRSTMRTQAIFQLQKGEIANCACTIEPIDNTKKSVRKWLLVGTAFLNPEETIPSMGRLLMLEAETMQLVQVFPVGGSIQSILLTRENKFLLLGVNNMIQAYDFAVFMPTIRANTSTVSKLGKLDLLCQKTSGTFIQSIVKLTAPQSMRTSDSDLPESIIVGDMTGRGVSTFELKECRQTKVKIMESASTHISLWVNSIVALSESQFIVFDQEGNLFIFQKNLYPTCIEEKLKLTLKGSFCVGEEVQSATFGSLRSMAGQQITEISNQTDQDKAITTQRQKKRKYVDGARQCAETEQVAAQDQVMEAVEDKKKSRDTATMIITRGSIAKQQQKSQEVDSIALSNPAHFGKILKDIDYARKFAKKTLEEIFVLSAQKCSIIYGTTDGSIGSLFQIPPKVYLLLQLLQHEMDQHVNLDLVQQKRSEYRQVKQTPATITELQNGKSILNGIIDGDLVEVFLQLPKNKKVEFSKGMLGLSGKGDEEFTELLTQIVSLVKKAH